MNRIVKRIIKAVIPNKIYIILLHYWELLIALKRKRYLKEIILKTRECQLEAIKSINKEKITCVFLVTFEQTWKYEYVYREMVKNHRFNPILLVCPVVNYGRDNMIERLNSSTQYFKKNGYNVLCAYNEKNDEYVDIRKDINPDILFYTNPYKGLIDDRYYIDKYLDKLTVYVPYAINNNSDFSYTYNLPFHNFLWRNYIESEIHLGYVKNNTLCKGDNAKCVGYPGIEGLIRNAHPTDVDWKLKDKLRKRIIWAPHHTIGSNEMKSVVYSCFLTYCNFMITLSEKYKDKVQFVFKPHPLLKNKLDFLWGKDRADDYYTKWKNMYNTAFHDGDYVDLFLTSDAMIHDSGSFIAEYLYVNKPVMRTMNDIDPEKMYNTFALRCLDHYYKAYNEQDIEQFIQNVINDVDPLKEQRTKFVNDVLMPKGAMPSENIINDIIDSIEHQRV